MKINQKINIDMDKKPNLQSQFEKQIISIIGITPKQLPIYLKKKCAPIGNCEVCETSNFIKETGLTEENIAIYVRFIRIWGNNQFEYCVGTDSDGYTLCYGREIIPLITVIHKYIFSHISTLAYTLRECEIYNTSFKEMYMRARNDTIKYWKNFDNGILALNNAYRRTKFENSKDILTIPSSKGDIVYIHGHQLKSFLQGGRPEQKYQSKYPNESIDIVQMGHFHKLGVFSINKFGGLISLTGTFLYPDIYFPEMLSHMGSCPIIIDPQTSEIRFNIKRQIIDIDRMKETREENIKNPEPFENKINYFRDLCKCSFCILPGNHDIFVFDEIYLKNNIDVVNLNFESIRGMGGIGVGDYINFTSSEMDDGKKRILEILEEENFSSISKMRQK